MMIRITFCSIPNSTFIVVLSVVNKGWIHKNPRQGQGLPAKPLSWPTFGTVRGMRK